MIRPSHVPKTTLERRLAELSPKDHWEAWQITGDADWHGARWWKKMQNHSIDKREAKAKYSPPRSNDYLRPSSARQKAIEYDKERIRTSKAVPVSSILDQKIKRGTTWSPKKLKGKAASVNDDHGEGVLDAFRKSM